MLKRTLALIAFGLTSMLAAVAFAGDTKVGNLTISAPYVRAMLPGAPVGGGYMIITNGGSDNDRLLAASSSRAGAVQIHEMKMDKDVMVMRELAAGMPIPAGKTVELKPRGYHMMFMKVAKPFAEGETVRTRLTFEKAGSVEIDFPVASIAANKPAADIDAAGGMPKSAPTESTP